MDKTVEAMVNGIAQSTDGPISGRVNSQIKIKMETFSILVDGKSAYIVQNPFDGFTKALITMDIKFFSII